MSTDPDVRERLLARRSAVVAGGDALGEAQQGRFAPAGAVIRDDVRGGAAQQDDGAGEPGQRGGDVPRMVPGAGVVVLVGPLVLLVHDDQAEVGLRREYGAPGADDEPVLALPHLPPLVEPLAGRQSAVEDGHLAGEPGGEALDRLPGERDLGHEHDGAPPQRQAALDGVQVDLRLAAARDALQQERPRRDGAVFQRASDGERGVSLELCEHDGPGRQEDVAGQGVAVDRPRLTLYPALLQERLDRVAVLLAGLRQRQWRPEAAKVVEERGLAPGAGGHLRK